MMKSVPPMLLQALNVGALLAFILTAAFNGLASDTSIGVFLNSTGDISDVFYIEITPAGWTFSIWGLIYAWQAVWIVYSLVRICRKSPEGPLYLNPVLLPPAFFGMYILNMFLNISWLLLFDRQLIELAFSFLFAIAFTLYICLWISYTSLDNNMEVLAKLNLKIEDTLVRAFVHNGLGIYAAWTTIASFLNMGFVIAYRANPAIDQSTASSISLGFITAALFLFVITDLFLFDRYSRYTITPYGVIVWALSGSLAKNFDAARGNSIFTIVLIVIGVLALIAKIVFVIIRSKSKPVFTSSTNITMPEKQDTVGMA
ncbi:uncharacterized protein LOC124128680 [Haliotis rufescens]|uniref:uncharacterized protein LOC124126487 n=1 Tax=Haliotis rufescens TaxID=6454 RepID=UPI001EAFA218|nr:uncharacterized protein LOC124126487 [Haliotis rufescens]XP_046345887.1 uncharacterized protein LOC124126487 [Haliotis rufescens]XP_046348072.1 uncharacterized protein LOC124128680 [Haliotis rufescens]XP_046348073.1 uncharacterized protein LOC124128680 [Haliotis rufescens]